MPSFREGFSEVRTSAELIGEPFVGFLRLAPPSPAPSPPDSALAFARQSIGVEGQGQPAALTAFSPNGSDGAAIFAIDARGVRRIDAPGPTFSPAGFVAVAPSAASVVPVDWNRDYRMDLAIAGRGGIPAAHSSERRHVHRCDPRCVGKPAVERRLFRSVGRGPRNGRRPRPRRRRERRGSRGPPQQRGRHLAGAPPLRRRRRSAGVRVRRSGWRWRCGRRAARRGGEGSCVRKPSGGAVSRDARAGWPGRCAGIDSWRRQRRWRPRSRDAWRRRFRPPDVRAARRRPAPVRLRDAAGRQPRTGCVRPVVLGTGAGRRLVRSSSGGFARDGSAVSGGSRQQRRAGCRRVRRRAGPGMAGRCGGNISTADGGASTPT